MSDSASKKKKGAKGDAKGGDASSSSSETFQPTAFSGAPIKVVNQFAALGDDFETIEVERPVPQHRLKGQTKRKATEKFIRADYTYQYDFEESAASKSGAKAHKKQTTLVRSDLTGLMETLTREKLETSLSRVVGDADANTRFQMLVEALEQHLLRARPLVYNTNDEHWVSFNMPIGEASEDVVEFIASFVVTQLSPEQQATCSQYLVRRLLENTRNPTNASAGFGLRLAAQVLFRENAWALISCLPLLKNALPKVSNVHTIPESDLDVILFIGAQLLANRDEDAPYAAFSYALEILAYTAFQKKNAMCIEFIVRAFGRYSKTYGASVDPFHTRLSTSVAERCLLNLSKLSAKGQNVAPAFAPLLSILLPLKHLILHMGLLSASEERVFMLWQKTLVQREAALCAYTLARYSPAELQAYDQASQRSIRRLVRDLARQLDDRNKLPPVEPELEAPIVKAIETFLLERPTSHSDQKHNSPGQKRHKHVAGHQGPRRVRGGFCARVMGLFWTIAFLFAAVYVWRHHVTPWNKELFHKLTKPVCDVTSPIIATTRKLAQPYLEQALAAVQPHWQTACAAVQPHIDATRAAVQPHLDTAYTTVQPHLDAICKTSTPYIELAKTQALATWAALCRLLSTAYEFSLPHVTQGLTIGRSYAACAGKKIDLLPAQIASLYATHIAPLINPYLQTAYQFTNPHLQPICDAITPYWNLLVTELANISTFINKHCNVW